jgi:hypothetical protein
VLGWIIIAAVAPAKAPALDEVHLAAVGLLRGRAEHGHPDAEVVDETGEGGPGAEGGGGDDVVAAGVAHLGEGVVLGTDDDLRAGGPDAGDEGRLHPVGRVLHLEPGVAQELGQAGRGGALLEGDLGVGVHPP